MLVGYSPALQTLGRVVADEYRALLGALLVVLILLLFASAGMYLLERDVQPDKFGSKLLYTHLYARGANGSRPRCWRCDVHHRERRGGRRDQP